MSLTVAQEADIRWWVAELVDEDVADGLGVVDGIVQPGQSATLSVLVDADNDCPPGPCVGRRWWEAADPALAAIRSGGVGGAGPDPGTRSPPRDDAAKGCPECDLQAEHEYSHQGIGPNAASSGEGVW